MHSAPVDHVYATFLTPHPADLIPDTLEVLTEAHSETDNVEPTFIQDNTADMDYDMDYDDEYEGYAAKFAPGPDECEDLEMYQQGGYHPVLIGDKLCDGKYTIVHKLGSGAVATVWLASIVDNDQTSYVALKIITGGCSSEDNNELKIHAHLKQKAEQGQKVSSVAALLDSFWIEGPNGKHLCLAFELSGPSIASLSYHWGTRKIRPDVVRDLASQSAKSLQELHAAGVVYGDLSAANILFRLIDIKDWSVEKVYETFGHPEAIEVQTAEGEPAPDSAPKVVYEPIQFQSLDADYLKPEIIFIDLADGQIIDSPADEPSGYSLAYTAPELLWFKEVQAQTSDIWALACIWFEMRSASKLFVEGSGGEEGIQDQINELIGPLPDSWEEKLLQGTAIEAAPCTQYCGPLPCANMTDTDGRLHTDVEAQSPTPEGDHSITIRLQKAWQWIKALFLKSSQHDEPELADAEHKLQNNTFCIPEYFQPQPPAKKDNSLSGKISSIGTWREWHYLALEERVRRIHEYYAGTGDPQENVTTADVVCEPPPAALSDEERIDFEDLLSSILKYEKADRLTLEKILEHPWLQKSYSDASKEAWLKSYALGRQYEIIIHD